MSSVEMNNHLIPFVTSSYSGIGESGKNIGSMAKGAKVVEGKRFKASASAEELKSWDESYEI